MKFRIRTATWILCIFGTCSLAMAQGNVMQLPGEEGPPIGVYNLTGDSADDDFKLSDYDANGDGFLDSFEQITASYGRVGHEINKSDPKDAGSTDGWLGRWLHKVFNGGGSADDGEETTDDETPDSPTADKPDEGDEPEEGDGPTEIFPTGGEAGTSVDESNAAPANYYYLDLRKVPAATKKQAKRFIKRSAKQNKWQKKNGAYYHFSKIKKGKYGNKPIILMTVSKEKPNKNEPVAAYRYQVIPSKAKLNFVRL